MKFSVVVAAGGEGPQIASSLKRLRQISKTSPMELIVAAGGPDDGTAAAARDWADLVVEPKARSRGAQWHAGAQAATGDLLFFMRADAQPPGNWQQALEHFWLTSPGAAAAVGFSVDYGADFSLKLLSAWSNMRVRAGMIGSDHGLCTTPEIYKAVGGYPDLPDLEDAEFSRRLAARGSVRLLPDVIRAAARRVRSQGALRYALKRLWLEWRYRSGASPEDLFRGEARP